MRAKRKFAAAVGIALVALLIVPVMTDAFWERMGTITTATENVDTANESSEGRVHFWQVAVAMANERPLIGVGHNAYPAVYDQYDTSEGEFGFGRAVHSSWFAILSEAGYPGLLLFVSILGSAAWACRRARRLAKKHPTLQNLALYAIAIEGALVAFAVGGSFVTFQYVEMLWHTLALSMAVDRIVKERAAALTAVAQPASRPDPLRSRIGVAAATGRPLPV
jgi:O-antigen ligase